MTAAGTAGSSNGSDSQRHSRTWTKIDGGRVVAGVVEVRADDAAKPIQPVGVAGPDEGAVVDFGEAFDPSGGAAVVSGLTEPAQPERQCPLDRRPRSTSSRRDRIGARYTATVTSLILAERARSAGKGGQLNGGLRSRRREPPPARRHSRATQSASSSVTRLAITRTAMFIRNVDRIASGPVAGRKRG